MPNRNKKMSCCPVCKSSKISFRFAGQDFLYKTTKKKFNLFICQICGAVFLNPQPGERELANFYPKNYYSYASYNKNSFLTRLREALIDISFGNSQKYGVFLKTVALILKPKFKNILPLYYKKNGKFLDVGCGNGENLAILKKHGWQTYGIEIDKQAVKQAQKRGLNVRYTSLEKAEFGKLKFDCIRMWHVLEHLPNPHLALRKLRHLLKNGGIIYLAIPNTNSLMAKIFGRYWNGYEIPRHLINYSIQNLKLLLKEHKFEVVYLKYASTAGLIGSLSDYLNIKFNKKFIFSNNLFLVVLIYPLDFLTDLLKTGDTIYLKIKKAQE